MHLNWGNQLWNLLVEVTFFLPDSFNLILGILLRLLVTVSNEIKEIEVIYTLLKLKLILHYIRFEWSKCQGDRVNCFRKIYFLKLCLQCMVWLFSTWFSLRKVVVSPSKLSQYCNVTLKQCRPFIGQRKVTNMSSDILHNLAFLNSYQMATSTTAPHLFYKM